MSSLWWFEPDWKSACCANCGRNIWDTGGDPDWGLCYECFSDTLKPREPYQEEPYPDYPCDGLPEINGGK